MQMPKIFYTGQAEFSHHCDAGWRGHVSNVVVEQVSPKMGIIVDSDGGGPYSGSKRQRYWPEGQASNEIGKKVQLSRVIQDVDKAAEYFERLTKACNKRNTNLDEVKFIMRHISNHRSFAGFKDAV